MKYLNKANLVGLLLIAALTADLAFAEDEQLLPSKSSMKAKISEDIAQRQAEFYNTLSDSSADAVPNQTQTVSTQK